MKLTKQRLKEIIKEELKYIGAEIEDVPEPPKDEPSSPSAEAMTVTRPFLAMTDEFADYLAVNEIPSEYNAIKQHLLDLGLPRTAAGIYALYGMESYEAMEESSQIGYSKRGKTDPKTSTEVGYTDKPSSRAGQRSQRAKRASSRAERRKSKQDVKKGVTQ